MTTACPTPTKTRYATKRAAEDAVAHVHLRSGDQLHIYECACTWWHLTKKPAAVIPEPDPDDQLSLERLVSMPDSDFREIVAADIRGEGATQDRAALRHPRNLKRWRRQLGELIVDIEQQLGARRDERTPEAEAWRQRGTDYRAALIARATECRRRRSEAHIDLMRRDESRRLDHARALAVGATRKELRAEAGERAVERLIEAHRDEFEQYLVDEFQIFGLQIPDRFARWSRASEAPSSEADEETVR